MDIVGVHKLTILAQGHYDTKNIVVPWDTVGVLNLIMTHGYYDNISLTHGYCGSTHSYHIMT